MNNSQVDATHKFPDFYTYPPVRNYPFVLRNVRQKHIVGSLEIVDIGVYELLKPPYSYSEKTLSLFERYKGPGYVVVPDFPDIFKEHSLDRMGIDNVEISKELLETYYDPGDIRHIPVIQGYFNDVQSFVDYSEWFLDNYEMPDKIGIGTVCKLSEKHIMVNVLKVAREYFPDSYIHAFGLSIRYLKDVFPYIDSFDSTAWTRPVLNRKKIGVKSSGSAKNKNERIQYFKDYLEVIAKKRNCIVNNQSLEGFFN